MKKNGVLLGMDLQTGILIDASPAQVWAVLADPARYPEWNPVIVRLEGELKQGGTIEFENRSGKSSMIFRPRILVVTQQQELRWLGRLWLPGLFDGEHFFILSEVRPGVTRLEHGERFRGVLVPFVRGWLRGSVQQGFERINAALKEEVERNKLKASPFSIGGQHDERLPA